ncbi:nicotinate-nicotinamide nucleotide adenylyltransferase [Marinicella rhabdoformis]|uniref:nicotinate-nicotinamide nucleotide adenylyltransferase n=1 Tax=Marinicella rhabdoformis TaxID=2580566 RepID=UPI0012AEDC4A|nr:nicotinate-nicotinamide nucleotide adenylyltransferase [Marinicella rhabdoformis]
MTDSSFYLVFGLTADPPHKGHEQVIVNSHVFMQHAGLKVKQFDLIPTFNPNLIAGKHQPTADFEQRMTMCQLIADDLNKIHGFNVQVNDIERFLALATHKKSYSYETLKAINHPNKLFVLSADHFAGRWPKFRKWHEWQNLVKENGLLIHQRPRNKINQSFINQLKATNPNIFVAKGYPVVDVSSTLIRNALKRKDDISKSLLSPSIASFGNIYAADS